jgi:hypothetical protein
MNRYYNAVGPHGSPDSAPIGLGEMPAPESTEEKGVVCEAWLGGLPRHYRRAARAMSRVPGEVGVKHEETDG